MRAELLEPSSPVTKASQSNFEDVLYLANSQQHELPGSMWCGMDFYAGVGGWSLGFALAGIKMASSFEWWNKASGTNFKNNRHSVLESDIRALPLSELPNDGVDVVVGSPPCVEFSYSNRGGSGDIADGLKDIEKFLAIVDRVRPRFWAMENVPRVAGILRKELMPGGRLSRFRHLDPQIHVLDCCEWGVPQQRKRCIAGSFDFGLLHSYRRVLKRKTLGGVISALAGDPVTDPVYGLTFPAKEVSDHFAEEPLSCEEERMNRDMKCFHPVYNNMSFPDRLEKPGRTVTATCTRVSRESIIVECPDRPSRFRRLTVRERACLQSFPISYEFYGDSHAQKLKMVGNAVPPLMTFYIAHAMMGTELSQLPKPTDAIRHFVPPEFKSNPTPVDGRGSSFPHTRRFRAAIPNLRFKSGVRFEFANGVRDGRFFWGVSFFYGDSKNIRSLNLNQQLSRALAAASPELSTEARGFIEPALSIIAATNAEELQARWSHRSKSGLHPYDIVDALGKAAGELMVKLSHKKNISLDVLLRALASVDSDHGLRKVFRNADAVLAGCLVGIAANGALNGWNLNR